MANMIQVYSIGLATLEIILIYKLSRKPGITGEYAASLVGYNTVGLLSVISVASSSFSLYIGYLTPLILPLAFAGLSAIAIDGLMPPVDDERVDRAVKILVKFGMVLAVISVISLVFPASVGPEHQL